MERSDEYQRWKNDRKTFRYVSNAYILLYNIECLVTNISIIFYLQKCYQMSKKETTFYYSVVQTLYSLVQMFGVIIGGSFADKTRNIRKIILLNLTVSTVSNFVYTLPIPLWTLLVSRALMGIPICIKPTVLGKYPICYSRKKFMGVWRSLFRFLINFRKTL